MSAKSCVILCALSTFKRLVFCREGLGNIHTSAGIHTFTTCMYIGKRHVLPGRQSMVASVHTNHATGTLSHDLSDDSSRNISFDPGLWSGAICVILANSRSLCTSTSHSFIYGLAQDEHVHTCVWSRLILQDKSGLTWKLARYLEINWHECYKSTCRFLVLPCNTHERSAFNKDFERKPSTKQSHAHTHTHDCMYVYIRPHPHIYLWTSCNAWLPIETQARDAPERECPRNLALPQSPEVPKQSAMSYVGKHWLFMNIYIYIYIYIYWHTWIHKLVYYVGI